MAFVYKRKSFSEAKAVADAAASGGDFAPILVRPDGEKIKFFKPSDGENCIRILPPTWEGAEGWWFQAVVHNYVGKGKAGGKYGERMLCQGDDCVLCNAAEEALEAAADDEKLQEEAKKLGKRNIRYCYVIDRDDPDAGLFVWAIPMGIWEDVLSISVDKRRQRVLYVDDPEAGYDVLFTRKGQGLKTKYSGVKLDNLESGLDDDASFEGAIAVSIASLIKQYPPETVSRIMGNKKHANGADTKDLDEVVEKPTRQRRAARKKAEDEDDLPYGGQQSGSLADKLATMDYDALTDYASEHDIDVSAFDESDTSEIIEWILANA